MKVLAFAGALLSLTALPTQAADISTKDLSAWCTSNDKAAGLNDAWCRGYIAGISDILTHAEGMCPGTNDFKTQVKMVGAMIADATSRKPAIADEPAVIAVTAALTIAYPCEKEKHTDDLITPQKPHYGW